MEPRDFAFRSRRSEILATQGMVATSHPLASQAGIWTLQRGGNAFDAAVAAAATLCVVEPMSTGIGGDAFALLRLATGEVKALNGSGRTSRELDVEAYAGWSGVPLTGALSVTVPGAVNAWATLLAEHGRLPLAEVVIPAIRYARAGFPVTPVVARLWELLAEKLGQFPETRGVYLPHDRPPGSGELFYQHDLAQSLELIATQGPQAVYEGELGIRIVRHVRELGGFMTVEDLASHQAEWAEPISLDYRGWRVYECPPNGQGLVALLALNILAGLEMPGWGSPEHLHLMIEALKLAVADGHAYIADPAQAEVPVQQLLSPDYAEARRGEIRPGRVIPDPVAGQPSVVGQDTVYLCTADGEGNCCSFIQSLYHGFGSGVTVPGTGILLQNRAAGFSLQPDHPNRIAPGKRPFHTIIPGLVEAGGRVMPFGVMGGPMQPQGHVLVITNRRDYGLGVQDALDVPRVRYVEGGHVLLEQGHGPDVLETLGRWGHDAEWGDRILGGFGGGQIIELDPETGVMRAGSEPRKDGAAVGY